MDGIRYFTTSLLIFSLVIISNIKKINADGILSIRLYDYNNTGSIKYDGRCCDGENIQSGECATDLCDYAIRICVTTSSLRQKCIPDRGQRKKFISVGTDFEPVFTFPSDTKNNRFQFDSWTEKATIEIEVTDLDGFDISSRTEAIDLFSLVYDRKSPLHRPPGTGDADYEEHILTGNRKTRPSQLRMGVAVHCLNNYYTDNCSKFCLPSNDCDGHYSCDNATGDKLCTRGWEGVNCSQPKSDETRCADTTYCHNGGTCAQTLYNPNQAYCCCPPGFTGARCEMDIDECPMMPCVHGQCFNTMGSYTCTCDFGFDGKNCDHNNTCGEQPCFNGGKCRTVLIQRTYITHVCDCPQGFTGKYCQSEITTTTSSTTTTTTITLPTTTTTTTTTLPSALGTTAAIVPTSDSTTSQPTTSTVTTSQRPQVHVTCNRDNYCRHKGECRNGTCICKPGFTGALCQIEIVECRSYPCQNGGRCRDGLGNYTCECTAGYKGKNCEIIEPETTTASPTVLNMDCKMCVHGTCKRDKNKSFCECQNGYSGRTCSVHEETKCGITEEAYCLKDNLCRINSRDRVACESDWKGLLCRNSTAYDANDPECPDISCKNDGHCYNGMCCCRDGFSGKYCEYEILHCMSSPCLNGGTCTNLFNDFECNCKKDFSGTMCEISLVSTTVTTHTPSIEHTSLPSSQFFTTEHTTLFRSSQHTTSSFQTTTSPFQSTTSLLESTTSNLDSTTPHVESTTQQPQTTRSSSQSSQFPTAFTTSSSPTFTSSSESNPSTPVIHSTTNSDFHECSGLQQFLNGTTIDTSYGKTKCTCIVGIIASCETIELPHQTTPTPEPEKTTREQTTSRMVTSTTMGTSTILKTTSAAPTVAISSSVPSTRTTKSPKVTTTPMVTTTEMATTEISTPIKRANRTIVLDGKIPQKDMDKLEKLLNSVLENSNKGLNCSDVKILGSEYVYNITKHPFTSITFNASNCFNDSDANANKSFNTNLANALSSSSLFKDHNLNTGNPNQFGISYSLFLIGYVYEHNTEAIKKNIKKTWEDTGNSNIDVRIIHKEFYIGKYGTLITEILYLVAHGTSLIPADQARPPSDSQMQKVFMTKKPVMNNVYTHDVHLPYRNGIRMSLKTTTRTSQYSIGTARRAVVTNWKKYLTDSGMCSGSCDNFRIDFAPNEKSSNKVGIDSMDVVYFPTLNGNELEIVNNGVSRQLSKGVNLCNCKTTRQRYVDISGRVKLKEDAPVMQVLTNLTQGISDRVWSKEHLLTMEGDLVTRIYFLPNVPIKKSLNQWPNPNMDGLMDSYNKSLRVIDEKINSLTVRMLYTVVMKGSLASDKKTFMKKNLLDSIFAANPDIQSRDIGIDFHSWGTDFYSEKGGSATKIQYMVDVLQTDSSLVDFTKPGDNHLAVSFQNSNLDICNCVARSVRTLWIEERKDANASMIEKAIRNAWMKANKGVNVNISASVRRTENGFEGDEKGTKAKKILYYVSPKQGTTAVDEDDLDEPSNTMIKSELQNLVPGIKVYTHELKRQEAEESEWWIYLAIGLGVLAIIIIILISVLIAVRTYRHRQSETLKQDPKTVNGFSKEHFSKEPVMEKNSNGFYDYDDEDAKNHSSTYIVNS